MFVKFVLLLFCCALINAKPFVQKAPHHHVASGVREIIQHEKLPDTFKDLIHEDENDVEDPFNEDSQVGVNPQVQNEDDDADDKSSDEINSSDKSDGGKNVDGEKKVEKEEDIKEDESEDEDEEEEEEEEEKKEEEEGKEEDDNKKVEDEDNEQSEEEEEDEPEEEKKVKDENNENNDAEAEKGNDDDDDDDDDDDNDEINPSNSQPSATLVGSENHRPESFKFPKQHFHSLSSAPQNPTADKLANTFANFFDVESLAKNFLPSKESSPKDKLEETQLDSENDSSLMKQIADLENKNTIENNQNDVNNPTLFNFDLDGSSVDSFISQAVPKNFENLQDKFQGLKDMLQKPGFGLSDPSVGSFISQAIPKNFENLKAKFEGLKDMWQKPGFGLSDPSVGSFISQAIPKNFENLKAKFEGLQDMLQNNIDKHFKQPVEKEAKVGFGGWDKQQKLMFGDLTKYVEKAVNQAQSQLEENGRKIVANNPPMTINVIPGMPITFKLKYVEGAHTLDTYGRSKAIRYNKLYAFTQYKFTELRYYYDIILKPLNLAAISKSIVVILNEAPTRMSLSVEKDNKVNVLGLEFVNPEVSVDCGTDRYTNYAVNYLINDVHPVIKQKLVEVVSRDSKLLLTAYLKDAQ